MIVNIMLREFMMSSRWEIPWWELDVMLRDSITVHVERVREQRLSCESCKSFHVEWFHEYDWLLQVFMLSDSMNMIHCYRFSCWITPWIMFWIHMIKIYHWHFWLQLCVTIQLKISLLLRGSVKVCSCNRIFISRILDFIIVIVIFSWKGHLKFNL